MVDRAHPEANSPGAELSVRRVVYHLECLHRSWGLHHLPARVQQFAVGGALEWLALVDPTSLGRSIRHPVDRGVVHVDDGVHGRRLVLRRFDAAASGAMEWQDVVAGADAYQSRQLAQQRVVCLGERLYRSRNLPAHHVWPQLTIPARGALERLALVDPANSERLRRGAERSFVHIRDGLHRRRRRRRPDLAACGAVLTTAAQVTALMFAPSYVQVAGEGSVDKSVAHPRVSLERDCRG